MPLFRNTIRTPNPIIANGGIANTDDETLQFTSAKTNAENAVGFDFNTTNVIETAITSFPFRFRTGGQHLLSMSRWGTSWLDVAVGEASRRTNVYPNDTQTANTGRIDIWGADVYIRPERTHFVGWFELSETGTPTDGRMVGTPIVWRIVGGSAAGSGNFPQYHNVECYPTDTIGGTAIDVMMRPGSSGDQAVVLSLHNATNKTLGWYADPNDGRVGVNTANPAYALDVRRYNDMGYTRADAFICKARSGSDPASPVNGMIFYDSDTHKFRGYANGAWVDLH